MANECSDFPEELLNTHVEPVVLKRTIRQQPRARERERSPPSPWDRPPAAYKDYHRPRVPRSPERFVLHYVFEHPQWFTDASEF